MLEIKTERHPLGVTILRLHGALDGSTFEQLILHVRDCIDLGTTKMILNFENVTYLSSAGLVALQSTIKMLHGEPAPDINDGWGAYSQLERDRDGGVDRHLKICSPTERVMHALDQVGFTQYVGIFPSERGALTDFT